MALIATTSKTALAHATVGLVTGSVAAMVIVSTSPWVAALVLNGLLHDTQKNAAGATTSTTVEHPEVGSRENCP